MAQKRLKSMIFPGLSDTYTVPQALSDLTDYSDFTDAQQDITDLQAGLTAAEESVTTYVVGNTNTTGVQLDPGTYVWVKNHSVLTDGLYTVGSTAIVQGGSVVDTNMNAVSEGGLNSLKNSFKIKSKTLAFNTISAGSYQEVNDSTILGKPVVGWELSSVASKNVSLLAVHCGSSQGLFARLKNNGSDSVSGASIVLYYLDV